MESDCFESMYGSYAHMVYWVAYGMIHNNDTAKEITQTVFMKAFEHWETICSLMEPQKKSWLMRTAKNAVIDRVRKEKKESIEAYLPERMETDECAYPETSYMKQEQTRSMWTLVQSLPRIYIEPILLHYFADLSQKEAAALLHISGGTYRSRLKRGRTMLERKLKGGNLIDV